MNTIVWHCWFFSLSNMSTSTSNSSLSKPSLTDSNSNTTPVLWNKVICYALLHIFALYGFSLVFTSNIHFFSYAYVIINFLLGIISFELTKYLYYREAFYIVAIYHILIIFWQTRSGYNSIIEWVQNRHLHDKYKCQNKDPFNGSKGLFFSYFGFLLRKEHPEITEEREQLTLDVLSSSFYICSQRKYYLKVFIVIGVVLPVLVPMLLWHETLTNAFFFCFAFRYICGLHYPWLLFSNSTTNVFPVMTAPFQSSLIKILEYLISSQQLFPKWE